MSPLLTPDFSRVKLTVLTFVMPSVGSTNSRQHQLSAAPTLGSTNSRQHQLLAAPTLDSTNSRQHQLFAQFFLLKRKYLPNHLNDCSR